MKKFQFKLEALVRYREHMEQMARQELAAAQRDVAESEERMARIGNEQQAREQELAREVMSGMSAERLHLYSDYLAGMEMDRQNEEKRREELAGISSEKREKLAEKSREKKLLTNLKERRKDAYYKEMFAEEQKLVDDMTVVRKARDINR